MFWLYFGLLALTGSATFLGVMMLLRRRGSTGPEKVFARLRLESCPSCGRALAEMESSALAPFIYRRTHVQGTVDWDSLPRWVLTCPACGTETHIDADGALLSLH